MDGYSRLIALLKILLPLMALGLLSTLFLLSRDSGEAAAIPYSDAEIAERLRDQQITGPFFSSTTAQGDRIALTAQTMRILTGGNRVEGLRAQLDLARGGQVIVKSDAGTVDITENTARLAGNVSVSTADGLTVLSDALTANLTTGSLVSPGAIQASGPQGRLNAGQMALQITRDGGPAQLIFTNGVKLVYEPKATAGASDP